MLQTKNYRALENLFAFLADVINRSIKHEKIESFTSMHLRKSEIIVDFLEKLGWWIAYME